MKDLYSALDVYDRGYYNFTINDIENLQIYESREIQKKLSARTHLK